MLETVICQFAKWPDLGRVKTRLARDLGDHQALSIHIDLVIAMMTELKSHSKADFQLWLSRNDTQVCLLGLENLSQELARFCHFLEAERPVIAEQIAGDLGIKMQNVFERMSNSYKKVLIVGSDCPSVTSEVLSGAIEALEQKDVVLAPAEDGGYVLFGVIAEKVSGISSDWLSEINWGSSSVLEQTILKCHENSLSVELLEELWDVDELADYQRWVAEKEGE